MQGEKATFLPRQTVVVLPQIAALDLPLTSCRLCITQAKTNIKLGNTKQYKKNSEA